MKSVLVIGAGPVGLTCAHVLSRKLNVTVVYPSKEFFIKSTSQTFKLDNDLIKEKMWGNANIWGNQHDTSLNYLGFDCLTSNLPSIQMSEESLHEEIKILNELWGIKPNYRRNNFSVDSGSLEKFQILKFKKTYKPKLNLEKVSFVQLGFESIQFVNMNQIMIDKIKFDFDFMVIAAGGLSNVFFLTQMGKQLAPRFDYFKNSLGVGYTNHVRVKILTIKFKRWVHVRPMFWRLKTQIPIAGFDYIPIKSEFTHSRITIRLWAIASKSLIHRFLHELGFYKKADVVAYIELPQLSSNFVKFNRRIQKTLFFDFQYDFDEEIIVHIEKRINDLIKDVSNEYVVDEVFPEKFNLKSSINMDSYHHFGGTRMGNEPINSTTDSFGLVHKASNIYVVGTSTLSRSFPDHPTWLASVFAIRSCLQIVNRCNE